MTKRLVSEEVDGVCVAQNTNEWRVLAKTVIKGAYLRTVSSLRNY